ncbi:hypothetical protein RNJ44_04715 [Nakaseomyces bracarensis]|uniref:Branchpoint-bridging protein n=1 Tax=Nakaseomyces bracarensis TaxID=273131 RepID=A0ABR4NVQ8_9SACH
MDRIDNSENRGRQPERKRVYIHRNNNNNNNNNNNTINNNHGAQPENGKTYNHKEQPKIISGPLTLEQLSIYQYIFRIREISNNLKSPNLEVPQTRNRSPSPPPIYDNEGKRTNTREQRYKKKLLNERFKLIEVVSKFVPGYTPPDDYKRPTTFQEKYYIPVSQYPGINFVGLLLGPRGKTLRKLQEDSGCKIAIRGKGSVKEGKTSSDLPPGAMDFSDPLHCLVIADAEEKIEKGIKACRNIVIKAVTSPEGQNDLKRGQLRELAELNGTLREANRPCPVCGQLGHRKFECPHRETFAKRIICNRCKQPGHATRDCTITDEELSRQLTSRYNNQHNDLHTQPPNYTNRYNEENSLRPYRSNESYQNSQKRSHDDINLPGALPEKRSRYESSSVSVNVNRTRNINNADTTNIGSSLPNVVGSPLSLPAGMSIESSMVDVTDTADQFNLNKPPSSLEDLEGPPGFEMHEENSENAALPGPPGMS